MRKIFTVFIFLYLFCAPSSFSEEIEIRSEIIDVSPGLEFFIIRVGEATGVEMGDGLIVHREGRKIAEAYIIEVRENISAAEIISMENDYAIQEGDATLIVKEIGFPLPAPEIAQEEVMDEPEYVIEEAPMPEPAYVVEEIPMPAPGYVVKKAPFTSTGAFLVEAGNIISAAIDADARRVFSYAMLVLREEGYSVISSNRADGILLVTKPISLSIMKELWADATAAIDHKVVASFDIKSENGSTILKVSAFKEHARKEKHIKRAVTQNSSYYNELVAVVSEIRERAKY